MDDPAALIELSRRDRLAARRALDALTPEQRVAVVCGAPVAQRTALLELMSSPEEVVPLMPPAELCFVMRASGVSEAGWLLAQATSEQIVACVDLDAWRGLTMDPASFATWLAALSDAGEETLVRAARSLDAEVLVRMLRERVHIVVRPAGDDAEGWEPPIGARSLEGQFHLVARDEKDDLADVLKLLDALFREDYWLYYRLLQGAIWELDSDLDEWALRWRTGRLEDLGFPSWDEAMRIYGYIRPSERQRLSDEENPLDVGEWHLPVWLPELPALAGDTGLHLIFQAAAELPDRDRRAFFYAVVGLANRVAVADRMQLSDVETLPLALAKAARIASLGLEHLAAARGETPVEVLRRVRLERLFQVGASLERDAGRPPAVLAAPEEDA